MMPKVEKNGSASSGLPLTLAETLATRPLTPFVKSRQADIGRYLEGRLCLEITRHLAQIPRVGEALDAPSQVFQIADPNLNRGAGWRLD